ncbi:MAG: hypothetical protein Q9217_003564, partial [Psora testacea]
MRLNDQPTQSPLDAPGRPLKWKWVAGDLKGQDPSAQTALFDTGCKQFHKRAISIPPHLSRVAISLIRLGNRDCVTGIRFITGRGPDTCLGYLGEGDELFFDTRDEFGASIGLSGLVSAVGPTGVHGIQIIPCAGPVSQWFGHTNGVPKTRRLTAIGSIAAIAACFDGYKMVALGVTCEAGGADKAAEVPAPLQGSIKEDRSLWNTALWSPDIPQSDWHLNEECFTGPGGTSLQLLRQISVFYLSTCIKAIDFHYSTDEIQRLGHQQLLGQEEIFNFHIHGSQGETIETIDVDLDLQFANYESAASFGGMDGCNLSG